MLQTFKLTRENVKMSKIKNWYSLWETNEFWSSSYQTWIFFIFRFLLLSLSVGNKWKKCIFTMKWTSLLAKKSSFCSSSCFLTISSNHWSIVCWAYRDRVGQEKSGVNPINLKKVSNYWTRMTERLFINMIGS